MKRAGALAAAAFLALAAWLALRPPATEDAGQDRLVRREFLAMGTRVSLAVWRGRGRSPAQADAALASVERLFRELDHDWAPWGEGALGRLNRDLAAGQAVAVPAELQALFTRAWSLRQASGGLFEPRIGALVRLWGFDDAGRLPTRPPPPAALAAAWAALQAAPGYDGSGHYGPAPGIAWDFGAIAKSAAVDAALGRLQADGFPDALVDAGGNLAVRGRHGDRPWRIAIRHPRADGSRRFLATLDARDEAVNTHGDYERYFDYGGRRYCHILDPRDGVPADSLESLTVVDPDAARADALGAALFVAGAAHWRELARRLGLAQVLAVDAQGQVMATPALAARLAAEPGIRIRVLP